MKLKSMALAAALTAISSPAGAQGVVMVRDVSYDMALVMAQTAIEHCRSLGFKRLRDNPISAGLGTTSGVVATVGRLPIKVGDETIGGIGVSGAPGGQNDEACAQAGIAKVADQLK